MKQTPSRHRRRAPAPNQEPRVIIYIDQSNNSGNIITGGGIIQQLEHTTIAGNNYCNIVTGGSQADLLAEIERLKKENARLMSITENMAERIRELREGQAAPGDAKPKAGR